MVPGYADYYPEAPGGLAAGRSIEPLPLDGRVLATGGFERNQEMRRQHQRAPVGTQWTTGAAGNTGDGILAGLELGAATGLMDDAWWGPSIPLPGGPYFCLRPGHDVRLHRRAHHGGRTLMSGMLVSPGRT